MWDEFYDVHSAVQLELRLLCWTASQCLQQQGHRLNGGKAKKGGSISSMHELSREL